MKRTNYDDIKKQFNGFIYCWNRQDFKDLNQYILEEAACYLSVEGAYPEGGRHGVIGIKNFFDSLYKVDVSHIVPYNYACHVCDDYAKQIASVVGLVAKSEDQNYKVCQFDCIFSNEWIQTEAGWKMKTIRMDMCEATGDLNEYYEDWYFENSKVKWFPGYHLPVVLGELDSPWQVSQQAQLSEEELILESVIRYAFGIDTSSFHHLIEVIADDCIINMAPFGAMDKREFFQTLKIRRQEALHWIHPFKCKSIQINGDIAHVELYRMAGHNQRYKSNFIWNEETIDHEYACARYNLKIRKEDGLWKVYKFDYYLGTIDIGKYDDLNM